MLGALTRLLSFLTGLAARLPLPRPLREPVYSLYSNLFGAREGEAEFPLAEYPSLSDFFIRRLRPGLRPMNGAVSSPVDSLLFDVGVTLGTPTFTAKGINYNLKQILLFQDPDTLQNSYHYFLFHLRPGDYHRIHYPFDCEIDCVAHAPGLLLPVNGMGRRFFPDVFCINERVLLGLGTEFGVCYLAMFGALNVGSMFVNGVDLCTNKDPLVRGEPRLIPVSGLRFDRGDELGGFKMGSSVMLFVPTGPNTSKVIAPCEVLVGQELLSR
jgi:phosphatidylserine decarboxylase